MRLNIKYDDWIETYSGIQFHPDKVKLEEIDIEDIAHALSMLCRFTGHCKEFYSVAQHSVLVSELMDNYKMEGLMHDASEAYMNDLHTILKLRLPEYVGMENDLSEIIAQKFNLRFPFPRDVKIADLTAIEMEHKVLFKSGMKWCTSGIKIDENIEIIPLPPNKAKKLFLERFYQLND